MVPALTRQVTMQDGCQTTIKAGEACLVEPGHLPHINQDCVMIEFSQDATLKELVEIGDCAGQKQE